MEMWAGMTDKSTYSKSQEEVGRNDQKIMTE